ncbi:helix-turn-helix transcriptional regulator [Rhodobacter capsulatus]|uniref:helix-turn-helix transcriptional regulator n=1 Tax=Rhodobacter capsulatus TaxID=1061 RepID=UPI0030CA356F
MLNCSTGDDGGQAGVKRVTVAEIETGRKQGSVATLRALADALGVSLDDLTE